MTVTDTNAEEILEKKKESQVKMMQKVWFATAVSAKSGHRRPLYFNLCSLSQAEEQQLLQRAAENVWLSAEQTGGQSLCPLPRGEKKDSRKRFPQQGPLTTKPDFGWQEQKLVSVHQKQENKAKAAGKDRQIERQTDRKKCNILKYTAEQGMMQNSYTPSSKDGEEIKKKKEIPTLKENLKTKTNHQTLPAKLNNMPLNDKL